MFINVERLTLFTNKESSGRQLVFDVKIHLRTPSKKFAAEESHKQMQNVIYFV